jgi:hypothetical protein
MVTVVTVGEPIFNPFSISLSTSYSAVLGFILAVAGFSILAAGFVCVIHYDRKRTWHTKEVEKAALFKNRKISIESSKEILEKIANAQKNSNT